ncbi:hypothetical protein vseg_003501 [Gypsophila vaccaria]
MYDFSHMDALHTVKKGLRDPKRYLKSWSKGDPCTSNWTGVWCFDNVGNDGYYHIKELQLLNMNLSGTLAPELQQLSRLEGLYVMWNKITGSIPKEIGNLSFLKTLALNGNLLTGSLPDELGFLANMSRLQLDENYLSGTIPKSFGKMRSMTHMNNNSFSGQLPPELSQMHTLIHLQLDNNNFSGNLPSQFSSLSELQILQLDNNHFVGAEIPESYQNLSRLVKLSLRNCSLGGALPDFSQISYLSYIDLSWNNLTGSIPPNKLSNNITTIDLSHNKLDGLIPENLSYLPSLQMLSLENNSLNGLVPAQIWNKSLTGPARLSIDFRYNLLSDISGDLDPPQNVILRLRGNPVCNNANIQEIHHFCDSDAGANGTADDSTSSQACLTACPADDYYEPIPDAPMCFCAAPIRIEYRLQSSSFTYFPPYKSAFESYVTHALNLELYQPYIDSYEWEEGPRLRMNLKLFPQINASNNGSHKFNDSEIRRIRYKYTTWDFPSSELFGPYELLKFTLLGPYSSAEKRSIKIDDVKEFTFKEMARATNNFDSSAQVGQGGYGKVYRGTLVDNTAVAVKRAEEGSLQGTREFLTEIHLSSRVHHRNLVSLVGYCGERGEQMLVYEFMPNGTLHDWLSGKSETTLSFSMRLRIALGAAKGILYLHREANPPIFHRDIKASNILLDSHLIAKVADFGLSRLAPTLDDEGHTSHHVSTVVKGTPGYLDPEYFLTHKLTDKSDVYSLRVVFLELLTGVPPISNGKNLVREVATANKAGTVLDIIDIRMNDYSTESVERLIALAMGCYKDMTETRPSMLDVVRELENILQMVPESMTMSDTTSTLSISSSTRLSMTFPHTTSYISGSELVTDVAPIIAPR